ncbi:hypothetical protein F5148DRAFT_1229976 [Russula earlei]|uniref:Uncharacterized protein n=1 Tax=Russula earlei TaxID=71964 RepID=A0ACC0TZY9_9AGAM|nr:hypothetical protein F5148DRAFT_1229976 [Russula earlei]
MAGANIDPNVPQSNTNRLPRACTYCKRLKMCKRCRSGKHDCIVQGRKHRSEINTNIFLPKQKDELIDFLVKQVRLHTHPIKISALIPTSSHQLHNPSRHTTTQHLQMINTGRM